MPSNKQYIEQAEELAAELGVEITTDGLNNEKLANLVSDLKAKVRDAELDTQVDGQTPGEGQTDEEAEAAKASEEAEAQRLADEEAEAAKAAEEKLPPYYVKKGKALTTRRGIRSDGDEITASDLIGGKEALEGFVKSGHVGKG